MVKRHQMANLLGHNVYTYADRGSMRQLIATSTSRTHYGLFDTFDLYILMDSVIKAVPRMVSFYAS